MLFKPISKFEMGFYFSVYHVIKAPMAVVKDPRGATNAMMYYSQMRKNGSLFHVEVLYNKATNTIMHFLYGRDAMGPLLKMPK